MLKAIDIANFFIDLANNDPEGFMTNLQVNKLTYFSQGWSLARNNRPLFDEELQAWQHGPVAPSVYHAFSKYGRERISSVDGSYSPDIFSSEDLELLIDVYNEYGKFAPWTLVNMTHAADGPWAAVYADGEHRPIPKNSMKKYFSAQSLPVFNFSSADHASVGYRDPNDNLLVLPTDYDE